jgi:glutaryl-CoA dehydrogenase
MQIMDNTRLFSQTHLMPRIVKDFREESFSKDILKLMGENGLIGCTLNEYGGSGLN